MTAVALCALRRRLLPACPLAMCMLSMYMLMMYLLLAGAPAHAAIDPYEFDNAAQRERYYRFVDELRCPKCQNQNLAGSDAPIAADLRRELHRLVSAGASDAEIVDFMVSRYGEFILYEPPFNATTATLWLAPALLVAGGGLLIWLLVRRRAVARAAPLSEQERAQLQSMLREDDDARDGGSER